MEGPNSETTALRQLALASFTATIVALCLLVVQATLMYKARRHLE